MKIQEIKNEATDNTWIKAIAGTISGIEERESKNGKKYWTATLSDNTDEIPLTMFLDKDPSPLNGREIRASGLGIKFEEYNGEPRIMLGSKAKIIMKGGSNPPPAAKTVAERRPPMGQTIGMSINNAVKIMTEIGRQMTGPIEEEIESLARKILAVSARLESVEDPRDERAEEKNDEIPF